MLHGDIYLMRERIREEYPNHDIVYAGDGRYEVIEKRRQLRHEGDQNGCPLFSMVDVSDVVFTFEHIPDMRVLRKLRELDLWRHPQGAMGVYDEMMAKSQRERERRDRHRTSEFEAAARDRHKHIVTEMDGLSKAYF